MGVLTSTPSPPAQRTPLVREIHAVLWLRRTSILTPFGVGHVAHVHLRHGILSILSTVQHIHGRELDLNWTSNSRIEIGLGSGACDRRPRSRIHDGNRVPEI